MGIKQITELFGDKLDSTTFTWQYYCGTRGVSVLIIFYANNGVTFNSRFICEGWCYGHSLMGGMDKKGLAVMLWDKEDGEKVWCHISPEYFETLYISYKSKK